LPYLTANLQFEIEEHKNVLMVPNAALRWKPRPEQMVAELRDSAGGILAGKKGGKSGRPAATSAGEPKRPAKDREDSGRIWVKDGNFVRPVEVRIGATDGSLTEVSGGDVKDDLEIVVGEESAAAQSSDTTNPFAPKLFKGGAKPKQQ
jgi:HlyD family secretion protein